MRLGILRLPFDSVGSRNCNIEMHLVRYIVVGSNLVRVGVCLGNESFVNFCWTVCKKGTKTVGFIPSVFLLFTVRMVDIAVLNNV